MEEVIKLGGHAVLVHSSGSLLVLLEGVVDGLDGGEVLVGVALLKQIHYNGLLNGTTHLLSPVLGLVMLERDSGQRLHLLEPSKAAHRRPGGVEEDESL